MEFLGTNQNPLEEASVLIPETTDNSLESSQNNPQQLNSFESKQVEETAELLADSVIEMTIPVVEEITLMGDITGDGGLDLDDVRELLRSYRSGIIDPGDPRDINGDGRLSLLDARELGLVVRNNTDQTAPNLLAGLVNDTGSLNNDQLTSDPSISGTLNDNSLITRFSAGFNDTDVNNYVNILGVLNENGTFSLDETQLQEINNNTPLRDGEHTLHFFTKDQWNNITTFDLDFILDSNAPNIGISLLNDTGISNSDNITNDPSLTGSISDLSDIETFNLRNDLRGSSIDITNLIQSDGSFTISKAILEQINDNLSLLDEVNSFSFVGTDSAGNISDRIIFDFTLDTTSPSLSTNLTSDLLTGNVGENLSGDTGIESLTLQIDEGEISDLPFNDNGEFTVNFDDFNLSEGEHIITVTATDIAGNNTTFSDSIFIDNTATELTIGLTNDTGSSDRDNISNVLGITGTLIDNNPITTFAVGLNNGGTLDVLDTLQPDGSFIFDDAKLREIAIASNVDLIPGEYTLNLTFNDGNSIVRTENFTFTYDPIPAFPTLTTDFDQPVTNTTLLTGTIIEDVSGLDSFTYRFGEGEDINIIVDELGNFSQPFDLTGVADGTYDLVIESVDIAGNGVTLITENVTVGDFNIPNLTFNLVEDTGISNSDNITQTLSFVGTATDDSQITILNATLNNLSTGVSNTVSILSQLQPNGNFSLDEAILQGINQGQPLTDGNYELSIEVRDQAGNSAISINPFLVLDTENPSLTLNTPMDNGVINEGDRLIGNTDGTGSEIVSISYQFNDGVTIPITVDNDGNFDQELDLTGLQTGEQILTLTIVDVAGNETISNLTLTIPAGDTTPPNITAMLINDTGSSNNDLITNNSAISGTINDASLITEFQAKFGIDPEEELIDIFDQLQSDGSFNFDAAKLQEINNNTELSEGQHTLKLIATDELGNTSDVFEFTFTLDSISPTPTLTSSLSDGTTLVDINFGETIVNATDLNNYTLTVVGGIRDGEIIRIANINNLGSQGVRLTLNEGLIAGENYRLDISSNLEDIAGNNLPENTAIDFAVAPPSITAITPSDGAEMVSLTRETVVKFNVEIDPNTVTEDSLYLIANGQRIAGRRVVSSTKKFVTFFYDEPLPSSTEIRVVVDGDKITTLNGIAIDADGDGNLGGIVNFEFRTLPLTQIEGTNLFGYVFDSNNQNADGSNIPLEGVRIEVEGLPTVFAITDETGFFLLENVPYPDFFVNIDPSSANSTAITSDNQFYGPIRKPFHSIPGEETQITGKDGNPFDIFLPLLIQNDYVPLSTEEATSVGLGEQGIQHLQQILPEIDVQTWERLQVIIPPNSLYYDDGTPVTEASIVPLPTDRIPAPVPEGFDPAFVFTVDAKGATNVDGDAQLIYPNVDGLAPGEKHFIFSFDHDAGEWQPTGTLTVSDDGLTLVSDPDSGVTTLGWRFVAPGTEPEEPPEQPPCEDFGWGDAWKLAKTAYDCLKNMARSLQEIGAFFDVLDNISDLRNDIDALRQGYGDGTISLDEVKAAVGGIQKTKASIVSVWEAVTSANPISKAVDALKCANSIIQTANDLLCNRKDCSGRVAQFICDKIQPLLRLANKLADNIDDLDKSIRKAPLTAACLGLDALLAGLEVGSPQNFAQVASIEASSTESPDPQILVLMDQAIQDFDTFTVEMQSVTNLNQTLRETQEETIDLQENGFDPLLIETRAYRNSYWKLTVGDFVSRGRTNGSGLLNLPILAPQSQYRLEIYNPEFNVIAISEGITAQSGQRTTLAMFKTTNLDESVDTDGEGLADIAEEVIGTSSSLGDTDGDGINDLAEIEQGLDPLGGQGFPTGIIASLPLLGEANAVVVEGSTENTREQLAYVATGFHGLAIVDASQFNNPIILGQLNLNGNATDVAVDSQLGIAAVATNTEGLQLIDVSDPVVPTLIQTVDISNVREVEIADGVAYVAGDNTLWAIDILTGEQLNSLSLPGSGTVTDIARDGTHLYTFTSGSDTFSVLDISSPDNLIVIGQTHASVTLFDVGLSVGNGVAYLAGAGLTTIDISDPTNPSLISGADTLFNAIEIARNGSGLGLVAAQGQGVALYDISDPDDTDAFITSFDTPGFTRDIAIASGIAYVADSNGGLQVINYLSFDSQGVAPTVSISSNADLDPNTAVIEVLEGSSVPIQVDVTDDVQVRNVELLVNGEVVSNDVSFPFDLSAIALAELPEGSSATVQVRATDTGGNSTLSNILTLEINPDTFAPLITSTTPNEGARPRGISAITVRFNEAIDPSLLNVNGVTLTNFGEDGVLGTGDDISVTPDRLQLSESGTNLFIFAPDGLPFVAGEYQLELDPSIISDRAGNPLNDPFTLNFTQRDIEAILFGEVIEGTILNPGENEIFTFSGEIGQRVILDGISSDNFNVTARLVSPSGVEVSNFLDLRFDNSSVTLIEAGTYQLIVEGGFNNATGDFSFRLLDADNATPLMVDTPVMGDVAANTSELFTFEGTAGDRIVFNNLDDDFAEFLTVYDPGNESIFAGFSNPITLESTGTYIVAVSDNFSDNAVEDYNFEVRFPVTTVESLTIGETVTGDIDESGNEDVYTFEGSAGQRLYFDGLFADSDFFSGSVTINSPSGEQIPNFFGASTGSDAFAPFTLVEDGTYELTVRGVVGGSPGNYSFRVLDAANATNITVDTLVQGTLTPGDSTQLFTFEGTEDQLIFLNEMFGSLSTSLTLYGPSNQFLADESSSGIELPTNSPYLVVLEGFSLTDSLNYSFRLETPNIIGDTLTIGSIVNGSINNPGEQISYSFEGTRGQRLVFDGLDGNLDASTYLVSPSNQSSLLFSISISSDSNPRSLLETGTYQLIVDTNGDATGDFSFRVLDFATATTLPLDTEVSGTLEPGQEMQLFTFEGQAGQTLLLDDSSANFGGSYFLYSGANEFVTSGSIGSSDLIVNLTGDGTYLLLVLGVSKTPVNYTFQLTETAFNDPGNPTGTEITIGETINSDISVAGEVDTYLFEGTAGQQLIFDNLNNNFFFGNVRLIPPTGTVNNFFANPSSDSNPVTLIEDGLYQLTVSGSPPGDYSFRLLNIADATPITIDTPYSGTFEGNRSAEIFTFEGSTDQPLFLSNNTSNYAATVYGPNNGVVSNNNGLLTLPGEGTYTLVLSPFNFNNESLNYSFELITPTFTETALTLGETVNGSIDQVGEIDVYTFEATPGQSLYFDGLDSGFNGGANVSLVSPSGASIPNFFGSSTSSDSSPFTLLEGGTYELRVIASDILTYNFRLLDVDDATAINLDTNLQGILDPGSGTELFTFNGTKDQTLTLATEFFGPNYTVYSPGNQFVGSSSRDFTLPGDGSYLVVVAGSSFDNTPINYDFSVEEPTIIPIPLTLGNTVNGTIANAGERIAYTFEGTVGQRLIYDGISGNSNINASLISPSGNEVDFFGTFFNTDVNFDRNPITLIENGTYTLIVDGEGSTTGDFSFRLSNGNSAPTLNFNTTLQGTLEPNTIRVLRFNGVANQTISLENLGSDSRVGFRLIGPGNQLITSAGSGFDLEATLPGDGTYFLLFDSFSGEANYRFRVV
ncbi:Ig-like domain-containing protein [Cyanothece sp. BG0011]|uniref:Ig-like domain-containing protein n=1 Tax=Cyanothece sp. BG0011 TaxID=2082950 RepID=UPI000D1E9712|nr:Ig-like domain-containing protein [Cyanothece sp. BG0011]